MSPVRIASFPTWMGVDARFAYLVQGDDGIDPRFAYLVQEAQTASKKFDHPDSRSESESRRLT